jgi:outer membrane lipase/esterase
MKAPACLLPSLFLASLLVADVAAQNRTFANQYSFGDSLSDSGNIFALTSALGTPNPPAPYFQGRFSNGPVFTERLGNAMALVATAPLSVKSSLNFAFGGANAAGVSQLPPSLGAQIALYQQRAIVPTRNDLFTVLAGPNDMIPVLTAASTATNPAALDVAGVATARAVVTNVQALIGLGAKNVVVGGLPNLGATPRSLSSGGPGGAGAALGLRATNAFNNELRAQLQALAASPAAADVNLLYVDLQGIIDRVVADYRVLGYNNASSYYLAPAAQGGANGDPNGYVFWDDIHPTAKTHALLASIITEQLNPELPLRFAATEGSAALALQSLASTGIDARTAQLAMSQRAKGRADVFTAFTYGDGSRAREGWRPKLTYDAHVVTTGVDVLAADGVLLGAAMNAGKLRAKVHPTGGKFDVEDLAGRFYAVWQGGPVSLLVDGSYGVVNVKNIQRPTAFAGFVTRAKTSGDRWGVGINAAWALDFGAASLRPWVGLRTERVSLDGYAEKDVPALAMDFGGQEAKSTRGAAGLDVATHWKLGGRALRLDFRGVWHDEIGSKTRSLAGKLADNFTRATTVSVEDGDGGGVEVGGTATWFFARAWSASLGYAADIRANERVGNRATLSLQTGF